MNERIVEFMDVEKEETRHKAYTMKECPECGSTNIVRDYRRGEIVCADCGLVVTEKIIDERPEWRAFTREERWKKRRIGPPITSTIHDKGLSTIIDWRGIDAHGRKLKFKKRMEIIRWRKWQMRTRIHSSLDRNLAQAMSELDRIGAQLGLPRNVREEAATIYRRGVERGLVRGRSIEAVMAASIYAACRIKRIPRTIDEIAEFTKSKRKDIARCYRLLLREVNVKVPLVNAEEYIPRIASDLVLSGSVQRRAVKILRAAKVAQLTAGKDPSGLAAASLYIAALLENERRTQKEIADAAKVTEVTIRNRYKDLVKKLNIKLPA